MFLIEKLRAMWWSSWIVRVLTMREHNRLKDILINHVFDHCHNEVVQRIDSQTVNISFSNPKELDEEGNKRLLDQAKESGIKRAYYTTRDAVYCEVLVRKTELYKTLVDRLQTLGFGKGKSLFDRIEKAHNELIATSHLARNKPIESQVKLTEKGLRHYLDGKSFEDEFASRRIAIFALVISLVSVVVAVIAIYLE
jgi:hypothetical protein